MGGTMESVSEKAMTFEVNDRVRNEINHADHPIYSGCVAYFPDALAAVAACSLAGNRQHFPEGAPLHWDKSKSTAELDSLMSHLTKRAKGEKFDTDRVRHLAKVAWRALAALQREIEAEAVNATTDDTAGTAA